jgi:hypothetical protein
MVNGELGLASHWLTLLRQPPQHQLSFHAALLVYGGGGIHSLRVIAAVPVDRDQSFRRKVIMH